MEQPVTVPGFLKPRGTYKAPDITPADIDMADTITKECERVYPTQTNPRHYGTLIGWRLGGNDPLDGISIYDGGDYWHFVTYGLPSLDKGTVCPFVQ